MPATIPSPSSPALKKQTAKITSKGQITIPAEIRRLLGANPGDKLAFQPTPDGVKITLSLDENRFEQMRGIGTGIPELDNGNIDDIVRYLREARGYDEVDDLTLGTAR